MTAFDRHRGARHFTLGMGLAAAVAAAVAVGVTSTPASTPDHVGTSPAPPTTERHGGGVPAPEHMDLVAYTSCDAMLAGLRAHTAARVGPYGINGSLPGGIYRSVDAGVVGSAASAPGVAQPAAPPAHSTTNVQEQGVGEPDTVETDGRRVVTVSDGVLRVVDAASRKITASLDLTMYAGADSAQLFMSADRVLVLLGEPTPVYPGVYGGPVAEPFYPYSGSGATFLLVDISAAPRIVAILHPDGGYVDARMVDGTARIVVASTPRLTFPTPGSGLSDEQRTARNRAVVRHAPLSAWLPTYAVSRGGYAATHTVGCTEVSHPTRYSGTSLLTVYTVDLSGTLENPRPVSLAADGTAVYASTSSLYVASTFGDRTQLHRFGITGTGRPTYLGSAWVPGALLDSYSMSEYDGSLRVVTTSGSWSANGATSVYVLDADTLRRTGSVGGLGSGENLRAVRFLGPLAYVVTFRSVDPLYVLDLHDPHRPRKAGELTLTGYSDYLHPVADGRLLGVGESVNDESIVTGLQVSLFDVSNAAAPRRLDRVVRAHTPSETPLDPHAFLYWPATGEAIMPIDSWNWTQSGAVLVLHVGTDKLSVVGTIRNPAVSSVNGYDSGIDRTLVIGTDIWTMSSAGLQVSDLRSLARQAWIPFG
jgi:uncharacterized secreted protein with C-terminal beta-propeller domain